MIELCIFDMGGVVVRDFQMAPELLPYLGRKELEFSQMPDGVRQALHAHSKGLIEEGEFWQIYELETSSKVPQSGQSLLGKFFHPVLDQPTIEVIKQLKNLNMRVVCGTNVIDSHYKIHQALKQYTIFDHVYASHLMHLAKPDRTFFKQILEQEKISAEHVFFTDDMEINVLAAKEEGLSAYVYSDAKHLAIQLKAEGIGVVL